MKFRLLSAHYFPNDKLALGDTELSDRGEEKGTIVGDGTEYPICPLSAPKVGAMFPTLEMAPLDDEAEEALQEERERLNRNAASMTPLEQLPLQGDDYERRYVPGFNVKREGLGAKK